MRSGLILSSGCRIKAIDLQDHGAVTQIAYHESVMHVAALQIGRQFPNSITLMIRGDSQVVSDLLDAIYEVGDRILLVGHSFGGGVVEELSEGFKETADRGRRVGLHRKLLV